MQDWIKLVLERFIAGEVSLTEARADLLSRFTDFWTPQGAQRASDFVECILTRAKYADLSLNDAVFKLLDAMNEKAA
jgi:hypothetical protein